MDQSAYAEKARLTDDLGPPEDRARSVDVE